MIPRDFPGNVYPFRFVVEKPPYSPGGFLIERYICPFQTKKGQHYIIQAEKYQHHIYVLKFYLKLHRYERDPEAKYAYQTNDGPAEAIRILNTCLAVMLQILKRDPLASGGFIGTPKPVEIEKKLINVQRFRIYSQLASDFFPPERWNHQHSPETNAYLLLNKAALAKSPNLLEEAQVMFQTLYPEFSTATTLRPVIPFAQIG
ncbi:hypothetical protein [Hymenobacter psoromatis]|uniref:hypothetical protein n=1 Tax=Hymenobacter psoromatis TaxID=1484116 RepID=UPI001CBE2E94|nr:hypothetical protein [Hymenobacter psoromatis]